MCKKFKGIILDFIRPREKNFYGILDLSGLKLETSLRLTLAI